MLIKKLLNPNPAFRLGNVSGGVDDILRDPFFSSVDWNGLGERTVSAPYIPPCGDTLDTSNFDVYEEEDNIPTYTGSQDAFVAFSNAESLIIASTRPAFLLGSILPLSANEYEFEEINFDHVKNKQDIYEP